MSIVERSAVLKRTIVDTAKNAIGKITYVFGADAITDKGTGKADCSSFTQWVLSQNGISVGRTTQEQWTSDSGVNVDKENLQPGDVVFFKNTYKSGYTDGVSHVGIYVGNGEFVHNSSSKGEVTTSKLNSSYYSEHYLGAKRFTASNLNFEDEKEESDGDIELKWWGDLMVVICVVALVVIALVFFIKAFGVDKKVMNGVKNLI